MCIRDSDVLVEVPGDQLHPLALHAPLVDLAGVDQLAAVDDRKPVSYTHLEHIHVQTAVVADGHAGQGGAALECAGLDVAHAQGDVELEMCIRDRDF